MRFFLFEDSFYRNLLPLVYFRPVWELRCGMFTLRERFERCFGEPAGYLTRTYLLNHFLKKPPFSASFTGDDEMLLVNGRWLAEDSHKDMLLELAPGQAFMAGSELAACRITARQLDGCLDRGVLIPGRILAHLDVHPIAVSLIRFPWDAVLQNGELLENDMEASDHLGRLEGQIYPGVHLLKENKIRIAPGAVLKPGVVIDAEHGPVWIDEEAVIMANAVIEGPVYIGKKSTIKIGAKIYENTTIGPVCKVGGEVEESIFQGYSNKQHDGFLGHSFVAPWVNLGADTNNSDLKNNYSNVTAFINGEPVDTGQRFVGLAIGDHSKCAINTMFNTGAVVGVCCNLFGAGMPPKFVPSFSWGGAEQLSPFNFDKCLEIARVVMSRRKIKFTDDDLAIFEAVKELAAVTETGSLL